MDPLSALRDYTSRGDLQKIVRMGDEFFFGDEYSFPCNSPTSFRSKQGSLYTLDSLVHYVNNAHLKHTDYMQNARLLKLQPVTFTDRKPLLDYLQGKISSHDSIEPVSINPNFPNPGFANPSFASVSDQPLGYDPSAPEKTLNSNFTPSLNLNSIAEAPISLNPSFPGLNYGNDPGAQNYGFDPSVTVDEPASANGLVGEEGNKKKPRILDGTGAGYINLIRTMERPLKDRETLLECRHRDFHTILLNSSKREEEKVRRDGVLVKSRGDDRNYSEDFGPRDSKYISVLRPSKGSKVGEGVPIILVPSAFQTLITIYNVKEFLEDGVFIPTDVKVKAMTDVKQTKPECVTVQKKFSRDRVVAAYEVRDKPSALKAEDWDRVVAVFVLGKEWQFKDWPFKDHVEIFNKIIGFYMRFEDDSVESAKTVKQWNVKIISISKNKRHQDRAAALEVWDRLEEFVRSRSHS
ncbi:protein CDC73 homolog [Amborella trichopoda]|uniref:PHP n=1 Tax=Amborella trichopoda TaxID=13333 RepID=W1P1S7_AMBTC|nr:protein CDC73 homolog [Amborella trichopoda]ERN01589.1 hypothetical protein AMTR_s00002p00272130 [Amborella trichopoda]|eukprot:XP_006839020.1 protein CDC73 homolog [Amborella trichopoda]